MRLFHERDRITESDRETDNAYRKQNMTHNITHILKDISHYLLPAYFGTIDELFESTDDTLFNLVINNPDHVLRSLLPPSKNTAQTQSWTKFADSVRTLYIECYLKTYISLVLRHVFLCVCVIFRYCMSHVCISSCCPLHFVKWHY